VATDRHLLRIAPTGFAVLTHKIGKDLPAVQPQVIPRHQTLFEAWIMNISLQILSLFILALPIASVAWTITHEEVVRELRDFCSTKSQTCRRIYERKFFYLFTCEYCFSHYVAAVFLLITRYKLLYPGWRGYLIAGFSLVFVANVYLSLFGRIRLELKKERVEIAEEEAAQPENKEARVPHRKPALRLTNSGRNE
jgi:hypothetical protein